MADQAKLEIEVLFKGVEKQLSSLKRNLGQVGKQASSGLGLGNLGKNFSTLRGEVRQLVEIQNSLGKQSSIYQQQSAAVNGLADVYGLTNRQLKDLTISQKKFNFGFLSLLFSGMMLQRVFGGALRNIFDSYRKIVGTNSELNRKVLKLGASWNYLKFSIVNALNNPVVFKFIEKLIDALEWMSDWIQEHPGFADFLVGVAAGLTALGTAFVTASAIIQVKKAFTEVGKMIKFLRSKNAISFLSNLETALLGVGAAMAVGFVIYVNYDLIANEDDARSRINSIFKGAIGGAIAGAMIGAMFGGVGAVPGAIIGAAAGAIVTTITAIVDYVFEEKPTIGDLQNVLDRTFEDWKDYVSFVLNPAGQAGALGKMFAELQIETDTRVAKESRDKFQAEIDDLVDSLRINPISFGVAQAGQLDEQVEILRLLIEKEKELAEATDITASERARRSIELQKQAELLRKVLPDYDAVKSAIRDNTLILGEQSSALSTGQEELQAMEAEIENYRQQLDTTDVAQLMKEVDIQDLRNFKKALEDLRDPLSTILGLFAGDDGFLVALKTISDLLNLENSIIVQLENLNIALRDGNDILPEYNDNLEIEANRMNVLANETDRAAIAQERLNTARGESAGLARVAEAGAGILRSLVSGTRGG